MFTRTALIAAALTLAGSAQATTVINGSFETPDYGTNSGTYVYGQTGAGWTFTGGSGITAVPSAWGFNTAPDGDQVAFLQNVSEASQLITGLTVGQTYGLTFSLSSRPGYTNIPVTVAFAGNMLANYVPATSWTGHSLLFTAQATSGTLSFSTNTNFGDHDAGLDNVAIGAVPEPLTWAMMVVGFGTMGAAMRRRRTSVAFG